MIRHTRTALLSLCIISPLASAATFTVTSTADSGAGSLRDAITQANAQPGQAHTITFSAAFPDAGVVTLQSALPAIVGQSLTIQGGSKQPRIDGVNQHQLLRVFGNDTSLELSDLTLRNGLAAEGGGCVQDASNLPNLGTFRATRVAFVDCVARGGSLIFGGALFWRRGAGTVAISDSSFRGNSAVATLPAGQSSGGAILTSSNVTIVRARFESNSSTPMGGGGTGGALSLTGAGRSLSITDSSFISNVASPLNVTFGLGGAIYQSCDGCSLQLVRSYLRGNAARFGGAVYARKSGAAVPDAALTLTNSTFVNNSVSTSGGAVHLRSTVLTLANNTFYNNDASSAAHIDFTSSVSAVYALGNLFAPTLVGSACAGTPLTPNPSLIGANLLSDTSCSALSTGALPNAPLGTISIDDPIEQIGVVRFTGSAVIDSVASNAQCEPRDARFQQRPIDGDGDGVARCDVGAFEHPAERIFRNGFEN